MNSAHQAGIESGMVKAAYAYGSGQNATSYDQPPPAQTPEQHRKKTLKRAVGLAGGLALAGIGIAKRKQIGDFAKTKATQFKNRKIPKLPGNVQPKAPKAPKPDGSYAAKGMGQAPTGQLKADVAKEFKAMGMSPPADAPPPPPAKGKPKPKKSLKQRAAKGALMAGGTALAGTAALAGLHKGSRDQFNQRANREEDSYTPGMSGASRA
jgi:hypothetical protein